MDWSLPGSSVHRISQARVLERVAISYSRVSSPRDRTHVSWVSCIGRRILYHWVTWEAQLCHLKVANVLHKGGMFRKNSMYIIYSETDHQPRWDAWDKCSGLVHWEDPEESGGEGGGRGIRDGEYM